MAVAPDPRGGRRSAALTLAPALVRAGASWQSFHAPIPYDPSGPMPDLVLRDIDPILAERIQRVAQARGWGLRETVIRLLEQGLFATEEEVRSGFETPEVEALAEAIAALKLLPAGSDL
jgi:hypothetical protein